MGQSLNVLLLQILLYHVRPVGRCVVMKDLDSLHSSGLSGCPVKSVDVRKYFVPVVLTSDTLSLFIGFL